MTKTNQPAKLPVFGVDLTKLEAISEQLELSSEQRRDRIELIKSRGWA